MASIILPVVPSVARFAVSGLWQGHKWVNVFHLKYSNVPGDSPTMNSVCQAVHTAYVNAISTICTSTWHLIDVNGIDLASRTGAIGDFNLDHAGTATTAAEPPVSIAVCASWQIQDRYRGGHPRSYFAGIIGSDYSGGSQLTTAGHSKWTNAAAALLTDLNAITAGASTWRMVCVRYFSNHQLLANPYVREVSSSQVHGRVDSMRRRLGKETP